MYKYLWKFQPTQLYFQQPHLGSANKSWSKIPLCCCVDSVLIGAPRSQPVPAVVWKLSGGQCVGHIWLATQSFVSLSPLPPFICQLPTMHGDSLPSCVPPKNLNPTSLWHISHISQEKTRFFSLGRPFSRRNNGYKLSYPVQIWFEFNLRDWWFKFVKVSFMALCQFSASIEWRGNFSLLLHQTGEKFGLVVFNEFSLSLFLSFLPPRPPLELGLMWQA